MTIVGIDFGTTNSLVAVVRDGRPEVIPGPDGDPVLPSAVAWDDDGRALVGRAALERAEARPDEVVLSVKRLLGRSAGEAGEQRRVVADANVLRLLAGGRARTPVEVAAEIVRALRARAEAALGAEVTRAVVTVPAHFHAGQRRAVRQAVRLAGMEAVRLLSEPVAAALAYGLDQHADQTFAVFDLGGGTFDLSVLRVDEGVVEVLATSGDDHLGGDDLDAALATALLHEAGIESSERPLWWRAILRARRTREALSSRLDADFELPLPDGRLLQRRVTRGLLEHLVAPVLARCAAPVARTLADAGLRPSQIEAVVLSGGATRSPAVQRYATGVFERRPRAELDPEHVVALGAALQAQRLAAAPGEGGLVLDATSRWLGVEVDDGLVEALLPRGSRLPASRVTTLPAGVAVHLVHGVEEPPAPFRRLARLAVSGEGAARVRVLVDADGLVRVSAGEGARLEVEWSDAGDALSEAGALLAALEGAAPAGEAEALTEAITQLRAAMHGGDATAVRELTALVRRLAGAPRETVAIAPVEPRDTALVAPVEPHDTALLEPVRGEGPFAGAGPPPDEPAPPLGADRDED